jgi:hypothetical protein
MDKEAAAGRDGFLFAVQQDPSIMPPPTIPPGPTAFSRPGDASAGLPAVQGRVTSENKDGLLDDVAGRGFTFMTMDPAAAASLSDADKGILDSIGAHVILIGAPGSDAPFIDADGTYAAWFESLGKVAVIARPDYYVYGSASDMQDVPNLISALSTSLGAKVNA